MIHDVDERSTTTAPRRDRYRTRAVVLIMVGALILVQRSGALSDAVWKALLPIALIAGGLDLVTSGAERRRIMTGALLGLVLLVPLMSAAQWWGTEAQPSRGETQRYTIGDVDRLRANVSLIAGGLSISSLDDDEFKGVQLEGGTITQRSSENRTAVLEIGSDRAYGGDELDLRLPADLPLELAANAAAGSAARLDFSDTRLERLDLELGVSDATIKLPESGVIDVTISSSAGSVKLNVPDNMEARMEIDSMLGDNEIDDRFTQIDGAYQSAGYRDDAPNRALIRISGAVSAITVE